MTRRDAGLLILLGAVWGSVFPLATVILQELPPLVVVVARTGLSAVLLVPLALRQGSLAHEARRRPGALLIAALTQLTIPVVLLTAGQQHVSAGMAGILLGTQPVWAAVFSAAMDRRFPAAGVAGVALGLAGVVLLFLKDLGTGGSAPLNGIMLVTAAAGYAAGAHYIQRVLPDAPPVTVAAAAMVISSVLLAPTLAWVPFHAPSLSTLGWLVILGTVATGGALVMFYKLIRRIGAVRANLAAYLAPGFALIFDLLLGHLPTLTALAGLALILIGSALAARAPQHTSESSASF